jgi:hypothetical protein
VQSQAALEQRATGATRNCPASSPWSLFLFLLSPWAHPLLLSLLPRSLSWLQVPRPGLGLHLLFVTSLLPQGTARSVRHLPKVAPSLWAFCASSAPLGSLSCALSPQPRASVPGVSLLCPVVTVSTVSTCCPCSPAFSLKDGYVCVAVTPAG